MYRLKNLYTENVQTCCTQAAVCAFTVAKGIASIANHLEIAYYFCDYFSFLSNPPQSALQRYYDMWNTEDGDGADVQNIQKDTNTTKSLM